MFRYTRRIFSVALIMCLMLVLLPTVDASELIIFHTNDMHARVYPTDDGGETIGLAWFAAAVKKTKEKNPMTLWLDAGDTFHGMPGINVSRGMNMVELANAAGIEVSVPGNHDFNYTAARLVELTKAFKGIELSANIVYRKNNKLVFKPYKIFKMKDGTKVGVFGLSTPECAYKTSPSNVTTVNFLNPVDQARLMISQLSPKVDVLICDMHMGLDKSSEFTSDRIAKEAPGIDLIIDGHSHTALFDGLRIGDTMIVQTGWHGYRLGQVKISLEDHKITGMKAQLLDADEVKKIAKTPDVAIENMLKEIESKNAKFLGEVVAHTDRRLSGERLIVRRGECELGNMAADALRWKTGADIAMVNGGMLRTDLPAGDVTRGDILDIFPFGNTIKIGEVSGKVLREILEHGVSAYPNSFGGFLDVSGVTFSFDPKAPGGSKVKSVTVNGEPLSDSKTYTIATTDFQFSGGDGYSMMTGLKIVGQSNTTEEIVIEYLNKVGMPDIEVGRIKILGAASVPQALTDNTDATEEKQAA
ncbi:MAG: bifunctional metallophosphatase/5'-nucleotidase [Selenomonadaceae bacterium]|nr:bifunctional metallophosphatase/5'-nucleotidase [Selenomonadaceae bacterium]